MVQIIWKALYQTKGSPDQPRDDHGRWTSGGGSGSFNGDIADTTTGSSENDISNADVSNTGENPQQAGDDGSFDVAGNGGTPKTNTVQNKQFKDACKGLGMTKDDIQRSLSRQQNSI